MNYPKNRHAKTFLPLVPGKDSLPLWEELGDEHYTTYDAEMFIRLLMCSVIVATEKRPGLAHI